MKRYAQTQDTQGPPPTLGPETGCLRKKLGLSAAARRAFVLEGGGVTQVYPVGVGTGLLWLSHRSARRGSKWRDGMSIESVAPCVVKEARHTIARLRLPGRDEP